MSWSTDIVTTTSKIYVWKYDKLAFAVFYVRYHCHRYKCVWTTVFYINILHKYLLFYYRVYLIYLAAKHVINGWQCFGHLGVPKIASGRNFEFLNMKVAPLDLLSLIWLWKANAAEWNIALIGKPVTKLWPFEYIQDGRQSLSWIFSEVKFDDSGSRGRSMYYTSVPNLVKICQSFGGALGGGGGLVPWTMFLSSKPPKGTSLGESASIDV